MLLALTAAAEADPAYTAVLEWNGPYFNAINEAALDQMVDSPVADIPFEGPRGAGARYAADGRKMVYVLDSGNDRIQGFEVNATYIYDTSSNFTWQAGGVTPAAHEFDSDQIVLAEYADPAASWIIPGSEVLLVADRTWTWVSDLSGFTAEDEVYTVDYDDTSEAPEIRLPANSLTSSSAFEVRYLITDYQGGATAAFGLGDVDYGNSSGASVLDVEIDESTGGPSSFQSLQAISVVPNESAATSDDVFVVDGADDSGDQDEELFVYTVTGAGVASFVEAYDDSLSSPADVAVARSGSGTVAVFSTAGGGANFWDDGGAAAVVDENQLTGHAYRATVDLAGNVAITDRTTGRTLVGSTAFANLADPLLIVPGFSADLPAAAPAAATYDLTTTASAVQRYAFIADAGNDRIKVVRVGDFDWAGDQLPSDAKTMSAQPSGAGLVGASADVEYDLTTPATVPDNWITWTLARPVEEGSLDEITFDPDGTPSTWTRVATLQTAGPGDQVYMVDWKSGQITFGDGVHGQLPPASTDFRFTYAVTPDILRYGASGSGDGQFSNPRGICARWNSRLGRYDVYVADTSNDRIQKLVFHPADEALQIPPYMEFVTSWSTAATASDSLDNPCDIDVEDDGNGDVYLAVADCDNDRIVLYKDTAASGAGGDTAPEYSTALGAGGNSLGLFTQIEAVDLVDNGSVIDVYVTDGARDNCVKLESAPLPAITMDFTGSSELPNSFPPSSSYTFTFTAENAPDGSWVDFYYDTASSFDEESAELCFTAGTIAPGDGTAVWSFTESPNGTPANGTYYLFAILRNESGTVIAQDATTGGELLTIDSGLTAALAIRDQHDNDKTLLFQAGKELSLELQLAYPDSVVGASFGGTFPSSYLEVVGISPGDAWAGTGYVDLVFNSTYDNTVGSYLISASVTGAPTGLNGAGPYVVAHMRLRAKSDALDEETRTQAGQVTLDADLSQITNIHGQEPALMNRRPLDAKVAYLGDVANTVTGTDSVVPHQQPNPDGAMNFADQIAFTLGWNGSNNQQDPIADIGPATGTAPDLIPEPDGLWDVDDLLSFSSQFSWFAAKGYTGSQTLAQGWHPSFMPLGDPVSGAAKVEIVTNLSSGSLPAQTVDVVVAGAKQLLGAMVRFDYDPSRLQFVDAEEGDLLRADGGHVMLHAIEGPGRVELDLTRFQKRQPGVDGGGTLARLTFRVIDAGGGLTRLAYDLRDTRNAVLARGRRDLATGRDLPGRPILYPNAPNPVVRATRITYALPRTQWVRLAIFDIAGRRVSLLDEGARPAGFHTLHWDARAERGRAVANGVYFYRLETQRESVTRKLLVTQ
ncbi:MAG: T9SS type A sorting domain-containing protein [Candidatus Eisenbacteria bacterium]|nr:T9SS type A sorting domain-containing protein [Candidatus Eisenbacteria bacterium]